MLFLSNTWKGHQLYAFFVVEGVFYVVKATYAEREVNVGVERIRESWK